MWGFHFAPRRGLRYWILYLLSRAPRNGAELMDDMEAFTRGWWRPSPGSVYPMLESLENAGLIKKREDGRYEITEKGKEEISFFGLAPRQRAGSVEEVLSEVSSYVSYLEDIRSKNPESLKEQSQKIKEISERMAKLAV